MKTTSLFIVAAALSLFLCSSSLLAASEAEQQLIQLVPKCDINGDGNLSPTEIWYARTLSRRNPEAGRLATRLIQASYSPEEINETKQYGPASGKKIKLFILSGQSNMVGQGLSAELPQNLKTPNDRILLFEDGKWQPLRPLRHTFGPEIAFAHAMAKQWPGETIGIVKQAWGGTGVLAWNPRWTKEKADLTNDGRKGNLWKVLTDKVNAAREAADCDVRGFLWQQGAKDMNSLVTAKAYLKNLSELVKGLRRETGVADLPLILGTYRSDGVPDDVSDLDPENYPSSRRPGAAYVIKAQWEAQTALAPAKAIPLRNLPLHPENIHYNTAGILQLGELFAAGFVELERKNWKNLYVPYADDEMPYRVMKPYGYDASQSYPVIVSLHGGGGRGTDNQKQLKIWNQQLADEQRRKEFPCYVLAPQSTELWNEMHLKKIKAFVAELPAVDMNRIYVMGHSMGGHGINVLLQVDPHYFAAAAPSAGTGRTNDNDFIEAEVIKDIPVWAFHGDKDTVCPIGPQNTLFAEMQVLGGNMKLTTFAGDGHGISGKFITGAENGITQSSSDRCDPETDFMTWLFSQSLAD